MIPEHFVASVCGPNWESLTYEKRDSLIIAWLAKRGWWLERLPNGFGWVYGRTGHDAWGMSSYIGFAIRAVLDVIGDDSFVSLDGRTDSWYNQITLLSWSLTRDNHRKA